MLLDHLNEPATANKIRLAVDQVLGDGRVRTPDLGGTATTEQLGTAIAEAAR
ncbi:Tartrate dehydrogenase [Mycobacteroides abscessus subsp. abscessus]|nr:Tartrate dehydrogenase [Mycobacteroides abscessus subsp. abscessus]